MTTHELPYTIKAALDFHKRLATDNRCPTCNAAPGKFCVMDAVVGKVALLGWDGNRASHTARIDLDYA